MKCEDLYRGIGDIDEKWIALAEEPEQRKEYPHLIGYELKKLLGIRYIWIFLAVFLFLNSCFAYFTASKTDAAKLSPNVVIQFLNEYKEHPERYDSYTQQDADMFLLVDAIMHAETEHDRKLDTVITNAERNLNDFETMGISSDAYAYRYQLRVIEEYTKIKTAVTIDTDYTYGWNEYFSYELVNIFIFLMILMIGSVLFQHEKQSGLLPILRTAKYGRTRTAIAKIMTLLLLTAFVVLLFVFSTWAVYGIVIGFSSPNADLQTLPLFELSANNITIGTYFFLNILMKFLSASFFAMMILTLSVLLGNYLLVYAVGISLLGCNLLLYLFPFFSAEHPIRHLNLAAISVGTPLFNRFRSINFFGNIAEYIPVLIVFFVFFFMFFCVFCVWRYAKYGISVVYPEWLAGMVLWILEHWAKCKTVFSCRKREKMYRVRRYSMSLVGAEIYKTLISSKLIFVMLLLLCVKIWYTVDVNTETISYAHQFYAEYMMILEGEITEEKVVYLQNEREKITETLAVKDAMDSAYSNDAITWAEYSAYREDYAYAISRDQPLAKVEKQAAYLIQLETKTGIKGWFFYDYGWEKLYTGEADLFLYMCILILLTGTFASEYLSANTGGAMIHLLRTMKKGRSHTFGAKLISSSVIAFLLALIFNLIDCIAVFIRFDMPAMSAPLASMTVFENISSVTVGGYLVLFLLLRILAAVMMAMLICAISEILCKYIPILGAVIILTLLPAICVYFGITAAQKINFLNFFSGTPLVLTSAQYAWLGSGWTMLAVWISLMGMITTLLLSVAKRMFVK